MAKLGAHKLRFRKSFKKIPDVMQIPNLIDIQKKSYEKFLQQDVPPGDREVCGLQWVFKESETLWD